MKNRWERNWRNSLIKPSIHELEERKQKLKEMLSEGVLKLVSGEETILFRSVADVERIIQGIDNDIAKIKNVGGSKKLQPYTPRQGKGL